LEHGEHAAIGWSCLVALSQQKVKQGAAWSHMALRSPAHSSVISSLRPTHISSSGTDRIACFQ
jgi:hypothetical protein